MSYRKSGGSGYRSRNDEGSVFDGGSAGGPSLPVFIGIALVAGFILFAGVIGFNLAGGTGTARPVAVQPTATPPPQPTAAPTAAPAPVASGGGSAVEEGTADLEIELLPAAAALAFAETTLNAPADTLVTLTFNNINDLGVQHNWVLVDGGADVATAVNTAASGNAAELFTPPAGTADGLAWTAMVNAGDSGSVTFRTPAAPGTYLFICTFPGHYAAGMIGDFVVE